ncbi:MAG: lysophospholipid acyltransferase family protein [Myxococcota bacterium]
MLRVLSWFFCVLPERVAFGIGRAVGWIWFHIVPVRRAVAMRNIERALGNELDTRQCREIIARSFQHQALFGVEALRFPLLNRDESARLVERVGFEHMQAGVDAGRGVVAVTAHVGNFDLVGVTQAFRGLPLAVIYKDIHWQAGHRFFFGQRRAAGIQPILPKGSEREILRALRAGKVVAFVIDQHMPPHRGIATEFFGMLASTTPAPVLFALRTGARLVTAHIRRKGLTAHHVFEVDPKVQLEEPYDDRKRNVRHNTERLNRWLEGVVRRYPDQWLWLHKRWKVEDDPSGFDLPEALRRSYEARLAQRDRRRVG